MKISAQILVALTSITVTIATTNIQPASVTKGSFALALSTIIVDFYARQSNTFVITTSSMDELDLEQSMILGNIFAILDAKTSLTWTITDQHYLNSSIYRISNVILIDSYESWR